MNLSALTKSKCSFALKSVQSVQYGTSWLGDRFQVLIQKLDLFYLFTSSYYLMEPHDISILISQTVATIIVSTKVALVFISSPKDDKHGELQMRDFHVLSLSVAHIISVFVYWPVTQL